MKTSIARCLLVLSILPAVSIVSFGQTAGSDNAVGAPQPAKENLDLGMYQRIRDEGFRHSHVMQFASALTDGIGGRLTGSPNMTKANEWTRDQLASLGLENAHLEPWGEFGMGWQQFNTWARMVTPDSAPLIAQSVPWSTSTDGPISGEAVSVILSKESDFDKYRGKLAKKIVLLGEMREVGIPDQPLFSRNSEHDLAELSQYPTTIEAPFSAKRIEQMRQRAEFKEKVAKFLESEHPLAIVIPSRDGGGHAGSGGTIYDDNGETVGLFPWRKDSAFTIPTVVMAIEHYGRIFRLLKANVPVTLQLSVDTKFYGDHVEGYNTIAEIPGTDPLLKDQVVMLGAHLDSWGAATGATDNGAGSVISMEAVRILEALHVRPRRTIRIALWSGEEEGLLGSLAYVGEHFGSFPRSQAPDERLFSEYRHTPIGPLELKPEWKNLDAYFNLDYGAGRIRGIYLQRDLAIGPIFAQWMAPLKDLGVTTITDRDAFGTDHLSFDEVGLPGFQFISDWLDYGRTHHSNMDTYDRLQPEDLAQAAVVEAIFVYNAAMRDQMLPREPLPHPELEQKLSAPLPNVMPGAEKTEPVNSVH